LLELLCQLCHFRVGIRLSTSLVRILDPLFQRKSIDLINLRLIVQGLNDSRHPPEFKEEKFGYPGARIGGKVTSGQTIFIQLPETISLRFLRWFKEEKDLPELRNILQVAMGEDKVYIENVTVRFYNEKPRIVVEFWYPLGEDLEPLEAEIQSYATDWLKENIERVTSKNQE
jgi:hypothetical protein